MGKVVGQCVSQVTHFEVVVYVTVCERCVEKFLSYALPGRG